MTLPYTTLNGANITPVTSRVTSPALSSTKKCFTYSHTISDNCHIRKYKSNKKLRYVEIVFLYTITQQKYTIRKEITKTSKNNHWLLKIKQTVRGQKTHTFQKPEKNTTIFMVTSKLM